MSSDFETTSFTIVKKCDYCKETTERDNITCNNCGKEFLNRTRITPRIIIQDLSSNEVSSSLDKRINIALPSPNGDLLLQASILVSDKIVSNNKNDIDNMITIFINTYKELIKNSK